MSATLTISFESSGVSDTNTMDIPDELLTATAIRNAMPSWDTLTTVVRDRPDATARLLQDYSAGRMDLALAGARNLGLIETRTTAGPEPQGLVRIVLLVIIAIIIILLLPGTVR